MEGTDKEREKKMWCVVKNKEIAENVEKKNEDRGKNKTEPHMMD